MEQNRDWTDAVRSALRDAELTPPATGWARLERGLAEAPVPRRASMRTLWLRVAAAAAAILACVVTGELLWPDNPMPGSDVPVLAASGSDGPVCEALPMDALTCGEPLIAAVRSSRPGVTPRSTPVEKAATTIAQRVAAPADSSDVVAEPSPEPQIQPATAPGKKSTRTTTQTTRTTIFSDDQLAVSTPSRGKISLGAFAAGALTGRSSGRGGGSTPMSDPTFPSPGLRPGVDMEREQMAIFARADYQQGEFRHHQPLSFGLTLRKEFSHGLSLESGLIYRLLWSDVKMPSGTENFSQKLHFLGVPVRMNWNFYRHKDFLLYIGAGGMLEKCVSAKFGSQSIGEPKVQWSVMAAAGAEYRLGKTVGLYFEPEVSYYFTQTQLRTYRTDSPATFTLRLGLRLSF